MGERERVGEREYERERENEREKVKVEFRPRDVNDPGSAFRGQVYCSCLN